jgi:hypothetical protein
MVYALRIHDSEEGAVDENSALIDGNATNKMVVSRKTANTARLVLASTIQGLRSGDAAAGIAASEVSTCTRHLDWLKSGTLSV